MPGGTSAWRVLTCWQPHEHGLLDTGAAACPRAARLRPAQGAGACQNRGLAQRRAGAQTPPHPPPASPVLSSPPGPAASRRRGQPARAPPGRRGSRGRPDTRPGLPAGRRAGRRPAPAAGQSQSCRHPAGGGSVGSGWQRRRQACLRRRDAGCGGPTKGSVRAREDFRKRTAGLPAASRRGGAAGAAAAWRPRAEASPPCCCRRCRWIACCQPPLLPPPLLQSR